MSEIDRIPSRTKESTKTTSIGMIVVLVIGLPLVLPYILISAVGGIAVRSLYPLYIFILGGILIKIRRPLYPAFMLAVFTFSPFIRRIADYNTGFAVFNLILLAPWLGLLLTIPSLLRRCITSGRAISGWPFAAIVVCVVYGSLNALFHMKLVPAIYEAMTWALPLGLCAFIMGRPQDAVETRRAVLLALSLMLPILTVYGVYQFLYAPLWDVFWLSNIDNPTFGVGEAFKIRVWSMMNSPGVAGVVSALAMLLIAGDSLPGMFVAACTIPLIALTAIRTAWLGLGVGLAFLLFRASTLSRLRLVTGLIALGSAVTLAMSTTAVPPEIRNIVSDRFATFSELSADQSTFDRLQVYESFISRLSESPWGEGFGANESTVTRQTSRGEVTSIDSGLLEPILILGVVAGVLFFVSFLTLFWQGLVASARLPSRFAGHGAVLCATIAMLPLGSNEIGQNGVLVWIAYGLLMAEVERRALLKLTLPQRPLPNKQCARSA